MKTFYFKLVSLVLCFSIFMTVTSQPAHAGYAEIVSQESPHSAQMAEKGFWMEIGKDAAQTLIVPTACLASTVVVPEFAPLVCLNPSVKFLNRLKKVKGLGWVVKLANPAEKALKSRTTNPIPMPI